ncbi:MAG: PQQ-binding-like beta-propeller repeat protein, partial [Planctomycetia bacterium]
FAATDPRTGHSAWTIKLGFAGNGFVEYGQTRVARFPHLGRLAFLQQGNVLAAVSVSQKRLVWARETTAGGAKSAAELSRLNRRGAAPNVVYRYGQNGGSPNPIVATPDVLVVRANADLVAVDPATGDDLWRRRTVKVDAQVFGDADVLFIAAADGSYTAHRTLDGRLLRRGSLGELFRYRRQVVGRGLFVVRHQAARLTAELWDPWLERPIWRKQFPPGTRSFFAPDGEPIFVEPTGLATVLNIADGATLLSDRLPTELARMQGNMQFLQDGKRSYLTVEKAGGPNVWYIPTSMDVVARPVNGSLRCYDRATGKLAWQTEIRGKSLMVSNIERIPVLITFGVEVDDKPKAGKPPTRKTTVALIDKRTGATLGEQTRDDYIAFNQLASNAGGRWIELRSWSEDTRIDFVDAEPELKPELKPEAKPPAASEKNSTLKVPTKVEEPPTVPKR